MDLQKTYSMCLTSQKLEEGFFPTFPEIFTLLLRWSMGNWSPESENADLSLKSWCISGLVGATTFIKNSGFDAKNSAILESTWGFFSMTDAAVEV